jgi:hypothetical protein
MTNFEITQRIIAWGQRSPPMPREEFERKVLALLDSQAASITGEGLTSRRFTKLTEEQRRAIVAGMSDLPIGPTGQRVRGAVKVIAAKFNVSVTYCHILFKMRARYLDAA